MVIPHLWSCKARGYPGYKMMEIIEMERQPHDNTIVIIAGTNDQCKTTDELISIIKEAYQELCIHDNKSIWFVLPFLNMTAQDHVYFKLRKQGINSITFIPDRDELGGDNIHLNKLGQTNFINYILQQITS